MIDDDLEDLIEVAGRGRVFSLLEATGWKRGDIGVPKWVWRQACHEVLSKTKEQTLQARRGP